MDLILVGCGNLGSSIGYAILLKSLEEKISSLTLIDDDIIEEKNFPYLFINNQTEYRKFIGSPKVLCLKWILKQINKDVHIYDLYDKYENIEFSKNYIAIDARDTGSENSFFKFKINGDGKYGKVIINPKTDNKNNFRKNYVLGESKYYSSLFSFIVCEYMIFNNENMISSERKEYIFDLKGGNFYGVSDSICR